MGDAAFRGVSAEQDGRFRNKEKAMLKKLAESGQFPAHFDQRVDVSKVNMDVMRPWIAERIGQLLGFEDDVVVEYVNGLLDDAASDGRPDPRKMQISLVGFLESNTATFMSELWRLLLSAQNGIGGIPQEFVEKKKEELRRAREQDSAILSRSGVVPRRDDRHAGVQREHGRRSRWNEQRYDTQRYGSGGGRESRRDFVDKNGIRTERVRDSGWGERRKHRSPSPDERKYPSDDSNRARSDHRRRSPSPRRRQGPERHERRDREAVDERRIRRRSLSYSPSASPPPRQLQHNRDERSVTPVLHKRRARSPSITPPRRQRSPTYSPQPHRPTVSSHRRRRSHSRSHSPSGN